MKHPIIARNIDNRVQATVGILFEPPECRQIILPAVAITVAKKADAQLLIVEQEAAEIGLKGLDADADRIEIITIRSVADMIIDEEFLDTEEMVKSAAARAGVDE